MRTGTAVEPLEDVPLRIAKGKQLRLRGILKAQPTIEEISFLTALPASAGDARAESRCRAFRVHGSALAHDGLLDGDHLVLREVATHRPGSIVLAEIGGRPVLRRVKQRADGVLFLASVSDSLPFGDALSDTRIIGAFAGVLRRRGFVRTAESKCVSRPTARRPQPSSAPAEPSRRSPGANAPHAKIRLLRGRLGSLESTYAATSNPRLRGALQNEAERVRRLLQNEAGDGLFS